tara:strand:- start:596 stop:733 length:138 start_codon:yes stop_codon:yes gene_type:complete
MERLRKFLYSKGIAGSEFVKVMLALGLSAAVALVMVYGAVCALLQ